MICPYCSADFSRVLDKRDGSDGKTTRRRRECQKCKRRYTTFERVETPDLLIVKKDGQRELFDRGKIRRGVIRSCEKRPISAEDIEKVVDGVEADLRKSGESEISSKNVGELVTKKLKKLDKIAYIRFASVYRQFADIGDFEKELANLSKKFKK
ncbi:transcriptional regulator NrdR [Candidatus Curtissbacteria bacterium RIFCSPLOWO2_12_FULL_38_9]|uniref:Transcriptional repressor NrdR n=2 Tax=Candidatus Curtissiibacteriota TaxID=1752717 RepID=A0A1F5G713_9BACT|nr:MAG: transcriptional regulator NrdR [Candidatus Curtissbacteria bacterium RIFCSPHIGHO2_02_FULL_40_16b]OGE14147.1 MAG: transcriptional regulator NrdR [Candidatus Curtissbacteria bacterium RIFCSPLOWO2_12_FULL_38_9]